MIGGWNAVFGISKTAPSWNLIYGRACSIWDSTIIDEPFGIESELDLKAGSLRLVSMGVKPDNNCLALYSLPVMDRNAEDDGFADVDGEV